MKIKNFGIDSPRCDQLFRLVCDDLEKRYFPFDLGVTVETCPLHLGCKTSRAMLIPNFGLSATIYELDNNLNLILAVQEAPKMVEHGLLLYRHHSSMLVEVFIAKEIAALGVAHISKRVFEFFVQRAGKKYADRFALGEAVRAAYPELEGLAGYTLHHQEF